MSNLGYIEVIFNEEDIQVFRNIVKELCDESNLYYSDVVHHIKGDVSLKLHLTLFYGLIDEKLDRRKIDEYIKEIKIQKLKLGKIFLKPGYLNLYQILMVEVLDEDGELSAISKRFKDFEHDISVKEFKPHLTLAYVNPEFNLTKQPDFPKEIEIKEIKYSKD